MVPTGKDKRREHRPWELGPRVEKRGQWVAVDLRPYGGGRVTMRNPAHPGWPKQGERIPWADRDIAERHKWKYLDLHRGERRDTLLGRTDAKEGLSEALRRFLAHREHTVEPSTLESDTTAAKHLRAWFGNVPMGQVLHPPKGARTMQGLLDHLAARGYKPSTVRVYRTSMSMFFKFYGQANPALSTSIAKPGESDVVAWSDEEMERVREAADAVDGERIEAGRVPYLRRMIELGLNTGARREEMMALRWESFDPERWTVRINRQRALRAQSTYKPLKGKRNRTALVLDEWWPHHDHTASGLVLPPYSNSGVNKAMRHVLRRAGLLAGAGDLLHIMRHTYARVYLERHDGDIKELQRFMGHKSLLTTERSYGHYSLDVATERGAERVYGTRKSLRRVK